MRVLAWTLLWLLLVVGAGWYLWRRLRWLWGRSQELGDTLADTERLLEATGLVVEQHTEALRSEWAAEPAAELAVFRSVVDVARERAQVRAASEAQRARRRAERLPGWARRRRDFRPILDAAEELPRPRGLDVVERRDGSGRPGRASDRAG
mgnify:FL=1